jgi:hypothetical protein
MKSYTDLEQSKKLTEILPLESADMWYHGHGSPSESERKYDDEPCAFHSMYPNWDKPCWSLAALLSVIPNYKLSSEHNMHTCTAETPFGKETVGWYDNPVDACYEMILKLHELNLL